MRKISYYIAQKLIEISGSKHSIAVIAYGIECTISTLLILILLMTAGIILKKPGAMLLYIAAWLPLRIIVGGVHANAHWSCTLISVGLGIISVFFTGFINSLPAYVVIPIAVICYTVFFLTAPVVHKNHPISISRRKKTRMIAHVYAGLECAVIILLAIRSAEAMAPVFMGFFTTAVLAVVGWYSKDTDKSFNNLSNNKKEKI